jgi:DNA transformation protein
MPRKAGPRAPTRGPLTPMRVSDGFRTYVLGQLAAVPRLYPRSMFGGVGLYSDDRFFGILAGDTLYLKVDDGSRARYVAAGMSPFKPYADRPVTMAYYQVPPGVLENAEELVVWAQEAISIAGRAGRIREPARRRTRQR